jgi:hypothetical protein
MVERRIEAVRMDLHGGGEPPKGNALPPFQMKIWKSWNRHITDNQGVELGFCRLAER